MIVAKPIFYTQRCRKSGEVGFLRCDYSVSRWEFFARSQFPNPLRIKKGTAPTSSHDHNQEFDPVPAFFGHQIFAFAKNFSPLGETTKRDRCPLMFIKPVWSVTDEQKAFDLTSFNELGARVWGESELAFTVDENLQPGWVTVANDITMHFPDLDQDNHLPYFKGQRGFLPVSTRVYSPSLLTDYRIKSISDGKVVRDGGSSEIHYDPTEMLSWLKGWAVIRPGDLVLMGSPLRFSGHTYVEAGSKFEIELNGEIVMTTNFI